MNASELAAWIGATTGTLALAWDVIKWTRSGARIFVKAQAGMGMVIPGENIEKNQSFVTVTAVNRGDRPATITHVVGQFYRSPVHRLLRRRPSHQFLAFCSRFAGQTPHILPPGERWIGCFEQSSDIEDMIRRGCLYWGIVHSGSAKPVLSRLTLPPPETDAPNA
ncbi:MAG: hypothetical protein KF755_03135 [Burkholderiaceae bacterium]|nr:hypothetical protein [Burkholderiaceae bacterium]